MSNTAENGTPPCPRCGHSLTAAYDDTDDSWWECDGCGGSFEAREIPPAADQGDTDA